MYENKHLPRLDRVWIENPIWFITTNVRGRRSILHSTAAAQVLIEEWRAARRRHGWAIGRYVVMPDHVHFFCSPEPGSKPLSRFMQCWKEWTSKRLIREQGMETPLWQPAFFDHLLRSTESYSQKWQYVFENPVRAKLVENAEDWPWQGEIESL